VREVSPLRLRIWRNPHANNDRGGSVISLLFWTAIFLLRARECGFFCPDEKESLKQEVIFNCFNRMNLT